MRESMSLWTEKESGIRSLASMQGAFNCKVNWEFIKNVNNKVHTPTNAVCIKLDKVLNFTLKNHFGLLLHVSVYDHHQGAFIRA
jgi:hypothetical protein